MNLFLAGNIIKKKTITICLVSCFVLAGVASADMVNLAVNTSGTVTAITGQSTTFERYNNPPTGTGVFKPFVRIQGKGLEEGYNTDGTPEFDTKKGKWTHSLKLGDVGTVDGQLEFLLDINQSQGGDKRYLSLDVMKIFLADSGSLDNFDPAANTGLGTLIYDLGDNWVKMDNTIFGPGSGTGDMRVLIPANPDWSPGKYLYLYTEFGHHYSSNAGFEEWASATLITTPEPATLALLGIGGLVLLPRKQSKK